MPVGKRHVLNDKQKQILDLLERGPMTATQIAKAIGATFGSVQWHIYVLEREGYVTRVQDEFVTLYVKRGQPVRNELSKVKDGLSRAGLG
ncbi:MAG: winged helix-turn-helix domain-containing protein [Thermoproteus sp.]